MPLATRAGRAAPEGDPLPLPAALRLRHGLGAGRWGIRVSKTRAKVLVWAWIGRDEESLLRTAPSGIISWSRMKIKNGIFDRFGQCLGGMLRLEHIQTPIEIKELLDQLEPGESHELRVTLELRKR